MRTMDAERFSAIKSCIDRSLEETGRSPTVYDIERTTGIPKSTVARYLARMCDSGEVEISGRRSVLTKKARDAAGATRRVPLVGSIACGLPKLAEENVEEYVPLPRSIFGSGELYLLRADGDSMINAGIADGDLVVIRGQNHAEPGQIVVALVDDEEATLKRYRPSPAGRRVDLVPENDDFETQSVDLRSHSLVIQGVAVNVIKSLG